ncbi:MAG TPA: DUF2169 domain-containing protein [Polyangiaceae bacterium]|nr:DUF2169 domain-containing protein [Polyangiaceae bacterium]
MWVLDNRTPYAAERTWLRDKNGAHIWLVVVKATFDLNDDGAVQLANVQLPPLLMAEFAGEPGLSSLRYESDLALPKPTTDVLFQGVAYAPHGVPVRAVGVQLKVDDELRKQLIVHGPRMHVRDGRGIALSASEPFAEFPLAYEWAYGGTDRSDPDPTRHTHHAPNPVGKGFARDLMTLLDTPAWRIEYANQNPAVTAPAGLGPLASHWAPRLQLAGTYDENWNKQRKPLLPEDYQESFQLCAPPDQRPLKHLRGGEQVELTSLTRAGFIRFVLPKIYLAFATFIRNRAHQHRARLATVFIEPELNRLQLVWETSLMVQSQDVDHLDETRIREKRYLW